ncbi:putative quinol monooxygenase [Oricola thermophila]|uniref:Antibiotic biosynthesis monooxygenase n=1 Tax=Oricola thermophila TaxID=2742145 RepID=A0A6N1VEZ1_9HYPH|nr:putative quinol monooxygenase [Oricola thermophila]QKV19103.1 antibiotic biosynthesis monooxygenase [Oricola thermophila]
MYCVTVNFTLRPATRAAFMERMRQQAAESLEREPGCRVFDVWTDEDREDQIFLYEVYDDRAAFDAHLKSAHFRSFDAEVADMVAAKEVQTWSRKT